MAFEPGNKLGKGRPPVIIPEVQKAIDANRNALKVVILKELDDKVVEWIKNIIERGSADGDVLKFKMLVEMAVGKMATDQPDFDVTDEEKMLVQEFRRRKSAIESGTGDPK